MFVVDLLVSINDDKITNSPLLNSSMSASPSERSSGVQRRSNEGFRHAHAERYAGQIHHCGLYQQAALNPDSSYCINVRYQRLFTARHKGVLIAHHFAVEN